MFKNIIFDWSGTLADDLALTLEASNYVFSQYGRSPLNRQQFRAEFQLPYPDYYARILPQADLNELEDHFRYAFRVSKEPVVLIPYALEFLEFCKAQGIRCFILSSVDAKAFDIQCRELGVYDYFEAIHAGIRHKTSHIGTMLAQHGLKPEETAFIGDMQHDVATAHCGGITSIAVLTGYNDAAQLEQAEPDMMVPNLRVLRTLMERMSTPLPLPADTIHIQGLELTCHLGVPAEERATPQRVLADIDLILTHPLSGLKDQFERTVDYDTLSQELSLVAQDHPRLLIETLADDLAQACLHHKLVAQASVTICKYILPQTEYVSTSVHLNSNVSEA